MIELLYIAVLSIVIGAIPGFVLYLFIEWNHSDLKRMDAGLSTAEIFRKAAK